MITPAIAAQMPPITIETASCTGSGAPVPDRQVAATMPENAPTDMKPAWPSDSSPRMPTVRLSDTAMTT